MIFPKPDKGAKKRISFANWQFGTETLHSSDKMLKRIKRIIAKAILTDELDAFNVSVVDEYMREVFTTTLRETIGLNRQEADDVYTAMGVDICYSLDDRLKIQISLPFAADDDEPTWSFTLHELVASEINDYARQDGEVLLDASEAERFARLVAAIRKEADWLETTLQGATISKADWP